MKELNSILNNEIKADQLNLDRHNRIIEFFTEYAGKPYNGHTWNKLPEGMRYRLIAGMHHIYITQGSEEKSHLIGYINQDNELNPDRLARLDACHGPAAVERIEQIKAIQADPGKYSDLVTFFKKLKKAGKLLKELANESQDGPFNSFRFPPHYRLLGAAGIESRTLSDIYYNK